MWSGSGHVSASLTNSPPPNPHPSPVATTREHYLEAARILEAKGDIESVREANRLKSAAARLPVDELPEAERRDGINRLKAQIAEHEAAGRFSDAAPLKTELARLASR